MKKIIPLLTFALVTTFISCEDEPEVQPVAQEISLNFEQVDVSNGRTKDGPGIRRGYKYTGMCFEYGTIVTDSQGNEHFWPADLTTKLNGFGDICPGPNEAFAFQAKPINSTTPIVTVRANYLGLGKLSSPVLEQLNVYDRGTLNKVPVYELLY